jgi:hypothetical protein
MKKHILIVPTVVLAVGGLGLFSVSASALPTSGVAAISKVDHVLDATGLPIEHVQFPCVFPFPCGYGYYGYGPGYYGYGRGYYGRGYYGRRYR